MKKAIKHILREKNFGKKKIRGKYILRLHGQGKILGLMLWIYQLIFQQSKKSSNL